MDTSKNSISEEAAAMKDRAAGAMKDKLGEATGNPDLERRGEAQRATGRARQAANTVVTGQPVIITSPASIATLPRQTGPSVA